MGPQILVSELRSLEWRTCSVVAINAFGGKNRDQSAQCPAYFTHHCHRRTNLRSTIRISRAAGRYRWNYKRHNSRALGILKVLFLPAFFAYTGLRTEISLVSGVEDWMMSRIFSRDWGVAARLQLSCRLSRGIFTLVARNLSLRISKGKYGT